MAHLLRLISGHDKRNPVRSLTICNSSSVANVHLREAGFSPGFGEELIQWSGKNIRRAGQKRIRSNVDNTEIDLTYTLVGGSAAELGYLQREIQRFFLEVRMYEEERQSVPVWLEYRWQDGLDDIPAPVFGQFSYYLPVLWGRAGKWPGELHTGNLVAGNIEGVVAKLICSPYWEGLQQTAATAKGGLELTPHGVLVPSAIDNYIPNPSFGHSTWNTGWTASGSLIAVQEIRAGFYRSLKSAARLANVGGASETFTVTLTLTATTYHISCYVRKIDGTAPTSADMQMWGQGAAQTTTFILIDGGPGYLAYASFTGVAASSTHGVQVKTAKTVYIDDVQLFTRDATLLFPPPFVAGNRIGCTWTGTAHNSTSTRPGSIFEWVLTDELNGEFTIAFWITPFWNSNTGGGDLCIFQYLVDANNYYQLLFNLNTNVYTLTKVLSGSTVFDTSASQTITYNDKIHLAIVQDSTNLRLYINGVLSSAVSITAVPSMLANGQFAIGVSTAGVSPASAAFDGLRIWKTPLTATQIDSLYDAEFEVKSRTGGGLIGMPTFFWNKDGDGIIDAVDDTNRDNFGIVAGVNGDVAALTEWRIQPPTSTPPRAFWLGRKVSDEAFDAALLFLEFQGTVDANSSGGQYNEQTASVLMFVAETITADLEILQGRYQYLARFYVATNSVTVFPAYHLSAASTSNAIIGDTVTVPTNANLLLRDFGDLLITFDEKRQAPASLVVYLSVTPSTGSSTIRADFIQLLPYPCCRVSALDASITIAAGDLVIINGTEAYVRTNSTGAHKYTFEFRGEAVDVVPNKYNNIFFLPGEEGTQYDVTDTGTFTVLITPRYTLPGGLVA